MTAQQMLGAWLLFAAGLVAGLMVGLFAAMAAALWLMDGRRGSGCRGHGSGKAPPCRRDAAAAGFTPREKETER